MIEIKSTIKPTFDMEDFIKFAYSELGMENDIVLTVYNDDRILDRLAPSDCRLQALLHQTPLPHNYNLIVRKDAETPLNQIVSHEMIHLVQYEQGRLVQDVNTGNVIFEGKEYAASVNYAVRPWEEEAFRKQNNLIKSYKKYIKSLKS